jgi:hypothetical protein
MLADMLCGVSLSLSFSLSLFYDFSELVFNGVRLDLQKTFCYHFINSLTIVCNVNTEFRLCYSFEFIVTISSVVECPFLAGYGFN